jgi:hypothetical protein
MRAITVAVLAMVVAGPAQANDCDRPGSVRLYRSSVVAPEPIYIATFDAPHGVTYNARNCAIAAQLFRGQPGVVVDYWCETAA